MAKISVSIDDQIYRQVRVSAGEDGVSRWLADAAAAKLRREGLAAVAAEIAATTGGPYTDAELAEARNWLHSSSTQAR